MRPQASHLSALTDSRRAAPRRRSRLRAILLATSALASAALPATVAHAADATWLTTQPSNDNDTGNFHNAQHWDNGVPDGNATFNASNIQDVTFTLPTTLGGITVTSGAGAYTFTTNQVGLTFSGDGLSVQSGASLTLNVNAPVPVSFTGNSTAGQAQININASGADVQFSGTSKAGSSKLNVGNPAAPGGHAALEFTEGSNAGQATITIVDGAEVDFKDSSKAGQATIINGLGGKLFFTTSGAADQASIESDGSIFFQDQASGGTARIKLNNNGALDISGLTAAGTTVGSLEGSGNVSLVGKNLAVGGNNLSTVFSGVIQDGGTGSLLTKEGNGALTLTGINTYTGATFVRGGALVVDGSIAHSFFVTVNAGGTLAGSGTVSSTTVNAGGTLAPGHSDGSFGTLTVKGDLLFTTTAGTTYLVQVSPAAASSTSVTGAATLNNGAKVAANFAPGTYVTKHYGILHADGGLNSTSFGSLVSTTNLSPMFKASLSYDANDVFLNLDAVAPAANACLNTNQCNVSNALANSFNLMNGIPGAFTTLTPAGLTQISGETAVGTQQATFDAMNQFMGVMLDPTVGALSGGRTKDAFAAMPGKAPPLAAEAFNARWGVWAAGFGGSQSISGDATLGSNKTTSSVFGSAAGAEYRFSPNTVAGFALAGGGTHFNVANGGSGNSDLFQAGAYVRHTQGAAFLAAALAYGWQDVTTNRTVTVAGIDNLRGRFNANALSGRLEGGYKVATAAMDVTPYAAGQFVTYRLPSYAEQAAFGTGTFALNYSGKDVTATRTELGVKTETSFAQADSVVTLRGRLAWAHDYNTDRNVQAAFLTLPGSAFVVNGAQPAADTALASLSAETIWRSGWAASATLDSQLSDTTRSYAGKGVVRYTW